MKDAAKVVNEANAQRADLFYEMWFEQPQGMSFRLTVTMRRATNDEVLEQARANWDHNVALGCRPITARP